MEQQVFNPSRVISLSLSDRNGRTRGCLRRRESMSQGQCKMAQRKKEHRGFLNSGKMLEESFLVTDCLHEVTLSSTWQLSLLVFVRIFNESRWKWITDRRQEKLLRRVAFLCGDVNLPIWKQMLKCTQIHSSEQLQNRCVFPTYLK